MPQRGSTTSRQWRGRLLPLLAITLTALNLRTAVTGFSPLVTDAQQELHFGSSTAGFLGTLVTLCFAVFAFVAPLVARRLGLERTAVVALGFTTAGILARSFAHSGTELLVATVIAFAGVGTSNVILIPLVREYFADRLKTVSTVYMLGLQIGQLAAPLAAVPLAIALGWRVAIGAWAVLTGIAMLLWLATALRARGRTDTAEETAAARRLTEPVTHAPSALWRSSYLWGLVGLMGMTALHTYALVTWVPVMFGAVGYSPVAGGALLSVVAGFGLLGALVVPPLTLRLRNSFVIVAICALALAAGYAGMLAWPSAGAVAWAILLGIGINTFPVCLTLIGARATSSREATTTSGIVQGIGYAIGCAGPLTVGLIHQSSGAWQGAYIFLLLTLPVTLVAGWFATRPRVVPA